MTDGPKLTYPGGFAAVLQQMEGRRDPFAYGAGEALPPLDVDLALLKTQTMVAGAPELGDSTSTYARKYRELAREFDGQSALLHLHGLLIAHLRRRSQPAQTAPLFERLWAEEAEYLMAHLDARWLVSAATSFGDHGQTDVQRSVGNALSVLFGMMKLYETERLFSGARPDQPHVWGPKSAKSLAMQMDAYAVGGHGGLDVNMLGRLWQDAERDLVLAPLAHRLLDLLIADDRTVFRRLQTMRSRRHKQLADAGKPPVAKAGANTGANTVPVPAKAQVADPDGVTWGVVALVKAPLNKIREFIAYHLDIGAAEVHVFLDAPDAETVAGLQDAQRDPRIRVTACDEAYWAQQKKPRMVAHRMRQVWVATQTYNATGCHWLAHIDVDEFLLPQGASMSECLAKVPMDQLALHLPPVEQMSGPIGAEAAEGAELFKLLPRDAGKPPAVSEQIFPTYGMHLPGGFISHTEGKMFARTGVAGLRFGIHALHHQGRKVDNVARAQAQIGAGGCFLGHAHAPNWSSFRKHLEFRLTRGSYRKSEKEGVFKLADLVDYLLEHEGQDALRTLYEELCVASPDRRAALSAHGMLLEQPLHLTDRVARIFGTQT